MRVSFWVFALISGFSKTLIYSIISEHHICARHKGMGELLAGALSQQRLLWRSLGPAGFAGGLEGLEESQGM